MLSSCADYTTSSQNSQSDHHISLFHSTLAYYPAHPPSRSSSLPGFTCSSSSSQSTILSPTTTNHHETRNIFPNDDSFSLHFNSQQEIKQENEHLLIDLPQSEQNQDIVISPKTISNTSSPSKHRVLNTPERLDQVKYLHSSFVKFHFLFS
jgi:TPP-dependent indolepyruvate ferredoxin oxidoreductase alpha subunit